MNAEQILSKMKTGNEIIRQQVTADIHNFEIPVKIEVPVWHAFVADELDKRGFTQMAIDCRAGKFLQAHARILAYEILFSLGGYETPLLCIPEFLRESDFLTYWRAIAISKNSPDHNGRRFNPIEPFATRSI